jgi:YhcH/YjgK/YiaL family protein
MIIDHITQVEKYRSFAPGFETAVRFMLENTDKFPAPASRYKLDENVDVMINQYLTKPAENAVLEAHNEYIDIQYVLKGGEQVGWAPRNLLTQASAKPEKDFYEMAGPVTYYPLPAGTFMILFPSDAHRANVMVENPVEVLKIVLKIKVEGNLFA